LHLSGSRHRQAPSDQPVWRLRMRCWGNSLLFATAFAEGSRKVRIPCSLCTF
jgi:hypothetical protein